MDARPATLADLPAMTDLQRRFDEYWFGAAERDEVEMREALDAPTPFDTCSILLMDGDRLLAAGWYSGTATTLLADPTAERGPLHAELLAWFRAAGRPVESLATDELLRGALDADGWSHHHSSFELQRRVADGWRPAEAVWPAGVDVTSLREADIEAVHRLIYVDAGWAEMLGHPDRDFESWRRIFVTDHELPEQQVLAWRDGRLVGVAMGRTFSDGAGWVAQLAVARPERGRGLGRALLLESLRRRIDAGATLVGLSVSAANRDAIRLYEAAGLMIDREWMEYVPPQ